MNHSARKTAAIVAVFFLLIVSSRVFAQYYPVYEKEKSLVLDKAQEKWIMAPFYYERATTSTMLRALRPFWDQYNDYSSGDKDVDFLWPIYSYRIRPDKSGGVHEYRRAYLFPFYFDRVENRYGQRNTDKYLIPLFFEGTQGTHGRYWILFPFIWYAENARLALPLFPRRDVTFAAIFPLLGDVRGYFARDRILFFLWPLFVKSWQGSGDDRNSITSFLWPIIGIYKGPKVSGFRLWPLFAGVKKEDEYTRFYWLWPLGHYRKGRISRTNEDHEDVVMFVPFFGRFRRPNISLDFVFPFYGKLIVGKRESTGYALALYNVERNFRTGIREERYLLFLIRHRTRMPGIEPDKNATTGGGFFPFYVRNANEKRVATTYLWPLGHFRLNHHEDYDFERHYFIPFYSYQKKTFADGRELWTTFLVPFFRARKTIDGERETRAIHLFFYHFGTPLDRLYAPLWTFWEKKTDLRTGEKMERVMGNAWRHERTADGSTRRQWNLLFFDYESNKSADGGRSGKVHYLFGLVAKRWGANPQTSILGLKVAN